MSDIGGVRGSSGGPAPKDPTIEDMMEEIDKIQRESPDPAAAVKAIIDKMNSYKLKDEFGHTLKFDSISEWKDAWQGNRRWQDANGHTMAVPDLSKIRDAFEQSADKLVNAQQRLMQLRDVIMPSAQLKELLDSGDIEGALMAIQMTRANNLDAQLGVRMKQMEARNAAVASLNASIATWMADGTNGADKNKAQIAKAQGDLSTLNNQSQYDMLQLQQVVNKRNEAFDLLTNLMGKFQKTMDGIVSNMR
jgi:hypothetical protein